VPASEPIEVNQVEIEIVEQRLDTPAPPPLTFDVGAQTDPEIQ
jgi:hypothetical protein